MACASGVVPDDVWLPTQERAGELLRWARGGAGMPDVLLCTPEALSCPGFRVGLAALQMQGCWQASLMTSVTRLSKTRLGGLPSGSVRICGPSLLAAFRSVVSAALCPARPLPRLSARWGSPAAPSSSPRPRPPSKTYVTPSCFAHPSLKRGEASWRPSESLLRTSWSTRALLMASCDPSCNPEAVQGGELVGEEEMVPPIRGFLLLVHRRRDAEEWGSMLSRELKQPVPHLHAGMGADERAKVMTDLVTGVSVGVAATAVIRAGVNVPALGLVVVWDCGCASDLFQSFGRVGRDGRPAQAVLPWWPGKKPPYAQEPSAPYGLVGRTASSRAAFTGKGLLDLVGRLVGPRGESGLCFRAARCASTTGCPVEEAMAKASCNAISAVDDDKCSVCRGDLAEVAWTGSGVRASTTRGRADEVSQDSAAVAGSDEDDEGDNVADATRVTRAAQGGVVAAVASVPNPDAELCQRLAAFWAAGVLGVPCPCCGQALRTCRGARRPWNSSSARAGPCAGLPRALGLQPVAFSARACFKCWGTQCHRGCSTVEGGDCKALLRGLAFRVCTKCLLPECSAVKSRLGPLRARVPNLFELQCPDERDLVQVLVVILWSSQKATDLVRSTFGIQTEWTTHVRVLEVVSAGGGVSFAASCVSHPGVVVSKRSCPVVGQS